MEAGLRAHSAKAGIRWKWQEMRLFEPSPNPSSFQRATLNHLDVIVKVAGTAEGSKQGSHGHTDVYKNHSGLRVGMP